MTVPSSLVVMVPVMTRLGRNNSAPSDKPKTKSTCVREENQNDPVAVPSGARL
jgi:hypothetical protein